MKKILGVGILFIFLINISGCNDEYGKFNIEEYMSKEYNSLIGVQVIDKKVNNSRITVDDANDKAKELLSYFNDLELVEWDGPIDEFDNPESYRFRMDISNDESIFLHILNEDFIMVSIEEVEDDNELTASAHLKEAGSKLLKASLSKDAI